DGKVDVAGSQGDDEHLPQPDDDRERGEGQRRLGQPHGRGAAGEQDSGEPDADGGDEGPDPGFGEEGADQGHLARSALSRRLSSSRTASTMIRIAPCAPICQSGGILRKLRNEPARVSVSAPMTAPMGETRPPTNSPPPRITPAIDRSV